MIAEILPIEKVNAVPAVELMEVLDLTPRQFYSQIRSERRAGSMILSQKDNGGGYWIWDGVSYKELEEYYRMAYAGAVDVLATLKPVRRALKDHEKE